MTLMNIQAAFLNQAAHPTFYSALTGTVAGLDDKMESSSYSLYVLRDDPAQERRDVYLQLWGVCCQAL